MVSCAACGLAKTTKTNNQGISFHQFPKGQKGESWVEFVKRTKSENWTQKTKSSLCSRHFSKNCFDRTSQLIVRLHPTAIPTIIVDRVKYQRCEEDNQHSVMSTPEPESGLSTGFEYVSCEPNLSSLGNNEDTPRERELKREIEESSTEVIIIKSENIEEEVPEQNLMSPTEVIIIKSENIEEEVPEQNLMSKPEPEASALTELEYVCCEPNLSDLCNNEYTPRERELKRQIEELSTKDIMKSKKIRQMQKVVWKQKKQIAALKLMAVVLEKNNLNGLTTKNV